MFKLINNSVLFYFYLFFGVDRFKLKNISIASLLREYFGSSPRKLKKIIEIRVQPLSRVTSKVFLNKIY